MPKPPSSPPDQHQPRERSKAIRNPDSVAPNPAQVAAYVAEMAAELSFMARHSRLELLAYLLDMARLEAANVSRHAKALDPQR